MVPRELKGCFEEDQCSLSNEELDDLLISAEASAALILNRFGISFEPSPICLAGGPSGHGANRHQGRFPLKGQIHIKGVRFACSLRPTLNRACAVTRIALPGKSTAVKSAKSNQRGRAKRISRDLTYRLVTEQQMPIGAQEGQPWLLPIASLFSGRALRV